MRKTTETLALYRSDNLASIPRPRGVELGVAAVSRPGPVMCVFELCIWLQSLSSTWSWWSAGLPQSVRMARCLAATYCTSSTTARRTHVKVATHANIHTETGKQQTSHQSLAAVECRQRTFPMPTPSARCQCLPRHGLGRYFASTRWTWRRRTLQQQKGHDGQAPLWSDEPFERLISCRVMLRDNKAANRNACIPLSRCTFRLGVVQPLG